MKTSYYICAIFLLLVATMNGQKNLNQYKYIIVPESYSFLREPDQYQLNALTKFLFEKKGYTVLMQNDKFPADLQKNRCLALVTDVEKLKAFLNTKLQIHLKDCNNEVVFSSGEGQSREKVYDKAYNLALRDAFKSFDTFTYNYTPSHQSPNSVEESIAKEEDSLAQFQIEELKKEVAALKQKQAEPKELETPKTPVDKKVKQEAQEKVKEVIKEENKSDEELETLFANPVNNGYTITDAASKILYNLIFSGKENVYIVKGEDAIVYKMNNSWIIAKANANGVSMTTLNVSFE